VSFAGRGDREKRLGNRQNDFERNPLKLVLRFLTKLRTVTTIASFPHRLKGASIDVNLLSGVG
jgi:hypothetical protein